MPSLVLNTNLNRVYLIRLSFSHPPTMQYPTLQNVRIRSTRDALQVFHGVATRRLPLITRRLDAEERRNIVPGNVYVWYALSKTSHIRIPQLLPTGKNVVQIQNPQGSVWSGGTSNLLSVTTNPLTSIKDGRDGMGPKSYVSSPFHRKLSA